MRPPNDWTEMTWKGKEKRKEEEEEEKEGGICPEDLTSEYQRTKSPERSQFLVLVSFWGKQMLLASFL